MKSLILILTLSLVSSSLMAREIATSQTYESESFVSESQARKLGDRRDSDIGSDKRKYLSELEESFKNELVIKLSALQSQGKYQRDEIHKTFESLVSDWANDGIISSTVKDEALEFSKKISPSSVQRDAVILSEKAVQYKLTLNDGEACSLGLDKCQNGSFCRRTHIQKDRAYIYRFQCVKKVASEGRCHPDLNQCTQGECKLLLRYTDINTCQTYGQKCSSNSECCSGSCNKNSRCDADYKCTTCLGIGKTLLKDEQKCCAGLYPNEQRVCEPIIPIFTSIKNRVIKFLDILIPSAHAASSAEISKVSSEINGLLSTLSSTLSSASVSSNITSGIISKYRSQMSGCDNSDHNSSSQELSCLNSIKTAVKNAIHQAKVIKNDVDEFNDEIGNLRKEAKEINSIRGDNASVERLVQHHNNQKNQCISKLNMWTQGTSNQVDSMTRLKNCLDSVTNGVKADAQDIANNVNQLKMQILDKGNSTTFISQGIDQSDYSLYGYYDRDAPILGNIAVSDMKNCRVNLFGDYLVKQSDDYFNVMITLLGMDFVTGSGGVEDYFTLDNWRMQTQTQEQDIETFDADNIKKDIFVSYAQDIKKIIKDYYKTLNDDEKIVWGYLFNNGRVGKSEKAAILKYFVENDNSQLGSLPSAELPEVGSYNIRRITRFEAVKYKFHLYKLYGKLKRKSIEMTCRCVDTMGPLKGDKWLKPDVEKMYINSCAGIGKYDKFVMVEDTSCEKVDSEGQCLNAQSKEYTNKVLESEELKHGNNNISGTETNKAGREVVKYKNSQNRDVEGELEGNKVITTFDKLKKTKGKHSKADKFIQGKKVTFEAERKENTKGRGEGLIFSEFLRDMAIMKVQALSEAATTNVFTISTSLALTAQFVKTYNWGYQKTKVHHYVKTKKYTWPQLILAWLVQLIGGNDGSNQSGYFVSGAMGSTTFKYDGQNKSLQSAIKDSLTSLHLRPERICEKKKFKSKTWKKARVPIGKIYYYKCIYNEVLPNDVCQAKLPVGLCMKTVYATDYEGDTSFILDPFIPEGTSLIKDDQFLKRKTVRTLTNSQISQIKAQAKEYVTSQFFDFTDQEADQFAEFVFKYHFWYPKRSRLIRYMTQGLIPYYENLMEKAYAVNMAIYDDMFSTASYALKMHNFYYNVDRGILNSVLLGQDQLAPQEFEIDKSGVPELMDFTASMGDKGVIKDGRINFDARSQYQSGIDSALQSGNDNVEDLASALNNSISQSESRNKRKKHLEDYMSKNGKSGELDKLKKIKEKRNEEFSSITDSLAASLRKTANERSQFRDGKRGLFNFNGVASGNFGPKSSDEKSSEQSDLATFENTETAKKKGKKDKGDKKGKTAIADSSLDGIDLDDLDDLDVNGQFSFGGAGNSFGANDLKKYYKQEGISSEKEEANEQLSNNDQGSIFDKISKRYKKSAFPKFLIRKK